MEIEKLYSLLDTIPNTAKNQEIIEQIKQDIQTGNYESALLRTQKLMQKKEKKPVKEEKSEKTKPAKKQETEKESIYPTKLRNPYFESTYIGLLLTNPKLIAKYYFLKEDCFFEDNALLNLYKSILFTEGEAYTPEIAKKGFNFAKITLEVNELKARLKSNMTSVNENQMESIYLNLKKLFVLRKNYLKIPIKELQDKIVEITDYLLYDQMSVEEVENTINQVTATNKFKRSILNENLTEFLERQDNNLTNGLALPFTILTNVFKGLRKGETMAFAMPSNSGKSRFTINLATYTSLIHQKKVLIISNEMSEEKMKLCFITTILNHPEIQKLHGQTLHKTEGELLAFQFRPDKTAKVELDKHGFIQKSKNETQTEFTQKLLANSSEFKQTIYITDWVNQQMNHSIYFINITDHTNDELRKVIMNYYYKEKIEYVFYDTLKTDTENIGNPEELKKTATILSNLAQNFNLYICSTLQLEENKTLPINLTINDLAVSRTVKEVLDTLCLMKQIHKEQLDDYEYAKKEVGTEFFPLTKPDDPDVRYYACVIDKNRAGAKPKLLFRINLAYNSWEELGYLRLKQQ